MKLSYSCAHCGCSISELAFKRVKSIKPWLECKCKKSKVKDFI